MSQDAAGVSVEMLPPMPGSVATLQGSSLFLFLNPSRAAPSPSQLPLCKPLAPVPYHKGSVNDGDSDSTRLQAFIRLRRHTQRRAFQEREGQQASLSSQGTGCLGTVPGGENSHWDSEETELLGLERTGVAPLRRDRGCTGREGGKLPGLSGRYPALFDEGQRHSWLEVLGTAVVCVLWRPTQQPAE